MVAASRAADRHKGRRRACVHAIRDKGTVDLIEGYAHLARALAPVLERIVHGRVLLGG